jgi:PPOX class probable F420-dependent enzyme
MVTAMDRPQLDAFLQEPRIGKLVTLRADGSPTVVPIWYEWDGETAAIFTTRGAKVRRIQADPRVALSVEEPAGVAEAWVTIEGTATIEESGGIELARRLVQRYYTPAKAAETLPGWEKMAAEWVIIRVTPTRISSLSP